MRTVGASSCLRAGISIVAADLPDSCALSVPSAVGALSMEAALAAALAAHPDKAAGEPLGWRSGARRPGGGAGELLAAVPWGRWERRAGTTRCANCLHATRSARRAPVPRQQGDPWPHQDLSNRFEAQQVVCERGTCCDTEQLFGTTICNDVKHPADKDRSQTDNCTARNVSQQGPGGAAPLRTAGVAVASIDRMAISSDSGVCAP